MRLETRIARPLSALLIVAALSFTLAGCLSAPTSDCGVSPKSCDVPQILRLPVAGITDIRTLDPANASDTYSAQFTELVFPGLVALDSNLAVIPWAAQALPAVSADGLTWTFSLRPGLRWSDGTAITAQTYAYAINRAENPCNAFGAAYYLYAIKDAAAFNGETCDQARIKVVGPVQTLIGDSITTPNPLTLQIRLAAPAAYFPSAMTYPTSYAVPQQLIARYGNKWTDHLADGGGFGGDLFTVAKWDHRGSLILRRNDGFWGVKPALREVDVSFYRSASEAYSAFQAGREDVGYAPVDQLARAQKRPRFHQIPIQQIDYYALNWAMAPFDDIRMRQAFALALDKTALATTFQRGAALATNHIVPEDMPGYDPHLLGPDGTQGLSGDLKLANQLATEYATEKKCGTATDFSHCPPVTLTLYYYTPLFENEADAARLMWLKAMPNYPITVSEFQGGLLGATLPAFQFWNLDWIEDYPDPQDWLSTNLACASVYNVGHACNREADRLMRDADANPDQPFRLWAYQQAEQSLVTDVAWIPLDQKTVWWETAPKLQGFTISSTGLIPRASWQTMYLSAG